MSGMLLDFAAGAEAMGVCCALLLILLWHLSRLCITVRSAAARCWRKRSWYLVFMAVFIIFLLSGFNLEGNVLSADEVPSEAAEKWVRQVEEEQRAIEALPYVQHVAFHYGSTHNESKVLATLWCCWAASRRSFKQVAVHCHLTERPTHLEALQELREKLIREHGGDDHQPDAKAVERRQELQAVADSTTRPAASVFDRMKAAACAQSLANQRASADARALAQAEEALLNATRQREAAAARAKTSKEVAAALAPQNRSKEAEAGGKRGGKLSAGAHHSPPPGLALADRASPSVSPTPAPSEANHHRLRRLMARSRRRSKRLTQRGGSRTRCKRSARCSANTPPPARSRLTRITLTRRCPPVETKGCDAISCAGR
jgi:hypothetical protein